MGLFLLVSGGWVGLGMPEDLRSVSAATSGGFTQGFLPAVVRARTGRWVAGSSTTACGWRCARQWDQAGETAAGRWVLGAFAIWDADGVAVNDLVSPLVMADFHVMMSVQELMFGFVKAGCGDGIVNIQGDWFIIRPNSALRSWPHSLRPHLSPLKLGARQLLDSGPVSSKGGRSFWGSRGNTVSGTGPAQPNCLT